MTEPHLPPEPPATAVNGEHLYYRRRIDELVDQRLAGIESAIRDLDRRADLLDKRLNWIFGALAVLSLLANIIGPTVVHLVLGIP